MATGRPIQSAGEVVKYQPPLMRFVRGSRSTRVRSRAIPLFRRRKIDALHQGKEPSSPKVTCIGQVRIRRSSSKSTQSRPPPPLKRRTSSSNSPAGNWFCFCFWVGKPPRICCSFRFGRRNFRPLWRKWVSFFCCKRTKPIQDPVPTESCVIYTDTETDSDSFDLNDKIGQEYGEEDEETEGDSSGLVPPKNALLLTRCRSAPQRSSYLASQIWGSPSKTGEEESRIDGEGEGDLEISAPKTESTMKTQIGKKACAGEKQREKEDEEGEERIVHVVLRRCKSEPATRSSGDPLSTSFWRMESTVSCRNSIETQCTKN